MILATDVMLAFVVGFAAALAYQATRRGRRWTIRLHYAAVVGFVCALALFIALLALDLLNVR